MKTNRNKKTTIEDSVEFGGDQPHVFRVKLSATLVDDSPANINLILENYEQTGRTTLCGDEWIQNLIRETLSAAELNALGQMFTSFAMDAGHKATRGVIGEKSIEAFIEQQRVGDGLMTDKSSVCLS